MANLVPTPSWDDVYQIEQTDRVLGGAGGPSNIQAQALLNRTELLKKKFVHVKDFGAKGDGVSDDTNAVVEAILSGAALNWGDISCTYLVNNLGATLTNDALWYSQGATVRVSDVQQEAMRIYANAHSVYINGLKIDAARKAYSGLRIDNYTETPVDVQLDNVSVSNCYRSGQAYQGGDGINIIGNFRDVIISNPRVIDVVMAAGAGIALSQGVTGISVSRSGVAVTQIPRNVMIFNPYIENIYCEDSSYFLDQDGIKVYTAHSQDIFVPTETSFMVLGGTVKNSWGRGIKSQSENGSVIGTTFIRTNGFSRGYGNHEIDFQVSGGLVSDIKGIYNGSRPNSLAIMGASNSAIKNKGAFLCKVRDAKISWSGQPNTVWPIMFLSDLTSTTNPNVLIDGVEVRSDDTMTVRTFFEGRTDTMSAETDWLTLAIRNSTANLREGALAGKVIDCTRDFTIRGVIDNFRNTNANPALYTSGAYQRRCFVSSVNCQNMLINSWDRYADGLSAAPIVGVFKPEGSPEGGLGKWTRMLLRAGETTIMPLHGYNRAANLFLLQVAQDNSTAGIFSMDAGSVIKLLGSDTAFVVGTTSEPTGTQRFKLWVDANRQLNIKNNTSTNRYAIIMQMG